MTTSEFAASANTKIKQIKEACLEYAEEQWAASDDVVLAALLSAENLRAWVAHFDGAEPAIADRVAADLQAAVDLNLRPNSDDEFATPVEKIREAVRDWKGPTASEFGDFMSEVENALQYQQECAVAARDLIEIQGVHTAAMHEHVLDILNVTLEELGNAGNQREGAKRERLAEIIKSLAGGPLVGIGGIIGSWVTGLNAPTPFDVLAKTFDSLQTASDGAVKDKEQINTAIGNAFQLYFGNDSTPLVVPAIGG
ncbi:hypothetical protein FB566_0855 [Stackebrandtia endophytica]|uniref:Uncharacterized protein n=1 Tax=Stackebrandtia endophytica TaxID=1496996 RepID=A0A543AS01_9ACTN|nr:hypothetical protein [Stackebrandtia endophytica]TQL75357.1 hypothetical protein FB566_0855 [Stackebrandtia endophytica]